MNTSRILLGTSQCICGRADKPAHISIHLRAGGGRENDQHLYTSAGGRRATKRLTSLCICGRAAGGPQVGAILSVLVLSGVVLSASWHPKTFPRSLQDASRDKVQLRSTLAGKQQPTTNNEHPKINQKSTPKRSQNRSKIDQKSIPRCIRFWHPFFIDF